MTEMLGRVKDDFVALLCTYTQTPDQLNDAKDSQLENQPTAQSRLSSYFLTAKVLETRYQKPKPSFKIVRGLRQDFAPNSALTCQCPAFRTEN